MLKVKFEDWIKEASKDLGEAIKLDAHKSDIWIDAHGYDTRKNQLLPYYLQYRMWNANRSLVLATWFLAIATIILAVITLIIK